MESLIAIDDSIEIILNVQVFISPERIDEFWTHFKPVLDKVVAEPECRYFVVGRDENDPTCLSWTEGWSEDATWLQEKQLTKPYYGPYLKATEAMFIKERVVQILKPQKSMACFKKPGSL